MTAKCFVVGVTELADETAKNLDDGSARVGTEHEKCGILGLE